VTTTSAIAPGTRLGPYVLKEPLGTGAQAVVYRAEDALGRSFAIKVRRVGVGPLDRRFLREFESMRALRVPGVVRVHEAGIEDEFLWFSMDLVDGKPFLEVVHAEKAVADRVARTIRLGCQLLEVLTELHEAGFVHRDVKPSNVLVDAEGRVRVLDFGIARFYGDPDTLSDSGQILGTVPFMAPEQLAGLPFDHRIDLFATGLLLYEAVDGMRPRPQTAVGWIPRICLERMIPLACKHKEVPRALSHVVEQLCAVDPEDRLTAEEAARLLRRLERGDPPPGLWPEPPFVDTGDWWTPLEGCIGNASFPAIHVLEGPAGSGRSRIAEQIHRHGVMQGIWPLHVRCRVDAVGQPIADLIQLLLGRDEDLWSAAQIGDDGEILRRMWPQLPIRGAGGQGPVPPPSQVAAAAARSVVRISARRPLLVVVHDLEQVDDLTAQTIRALAAEAGPRLGLLLLHEVRWESRGSRPLVAALKAHGAGVHAMPPLTERQAQDIAVCLCPNGSEPRTAPATPQRAVEVGLEALAAWRGESWALPESGLWPLVVVPRVPERVLTRIAGPRALESPWVVRDDLTGHVQAAGGFAPKALAARLTDLRESARKLDEAWSAEGSSPADLVPLRLLAGDPYGAWEPAVRAAVEAEAVGRYADARRWLLLTDMLPQDAGTGHLERGFDLVYTTARVALRTEAGAPRFELVDEVEKRAKTTAQEQLGRVLRGEFQIRAGEARAALVAMLRVASPLQNPEPIVAVKALLAATHARFLLGQFTEAAGQLERAEALLRDHPEPRLQVLVANWRSELLYRNSDLQACRTLLQDTLRTASQAAYVRGAAFAASRLGQVLRLLGKRREAEHQMRAAQLAFLDTTDLALGAEAELELATLRAERGDAAGARYLLDDAIRRIQGLGLDPLLGRAMRVVLQISILRVDATEAAQALDALAQSPDPEAPAALVRWWRVRGDVEHALVVSPPKEPGYGHVMWRLERARAALAAQVGGIARTEAEAAYADARRLGFAELELYGKLLLGAIDRVDDGAWRELQRQASMSLFTEVYLGAIEMDARRLAAAGQQADAHGRWRTLRARAEELGYRPGVEEAAGWLQGLDRA
jgi:tRNA A-37 threonylcarbamoyl transferase component Bud32